MLIIGLTGSIATGKSTVSKLLGSPPYSLPIVDADKIARQVVEPGTAGYTAVVKAFGPTTPDILEPPSLENGGELGPGGKGRPLNRHALGRRVFDKGTEADRKLLNSILHPRIGREMFKQIILAYLRGSWAVVLDIPLLFESRWEPYCGVIMVVAVKDPEVQVQRLMDRDAHLSETDARKRMATQVDVREKAKRAQHRGRDRGVVLWNDAGKAELKESLDSAMAWIKRKSPRWWALLLLLNPPLMLVVMQMNLVWGVYTQHAWLQKKKQDAQRKPVKSAKL